MIVNENPAAFAELIRRADSYQKALSPRAEGLHVSDLIYCRRKSWFRRYARRAAIKTGVPVPEEYDTDTLVMFLLGHGYHALLEQGIEERRVVLDFSGVKVHGTIDGEVRPDGSPHEFKTTRASSARAIQEVQHYIEQVAAYCLGLGTDHAQLSVIYINGAYNKDGSGMKPTGRTYDLEFTQEELRDWKLELARRAAQLLGDGPPPLPCHRTWECRYCPFNSKVGGPCTGGPGDQRHWFQIDTLPSFVESVLEEGL